jgi:hypothetical protein
MKPLTWLITFGVLASAGKVVNFDTFPLGKAPPGWTIAVTNPGGAPLWEIVKDGSAPTQPYVLAQVSHDAASGRVPLAILDGLRLRDGDVGVRIKPVSGNEDRAGGVVWRYRDPNNYYLARANALTKDVVCSRCRMAGASKSFRAFITTSSRTNGAF